MTDVAARTGDDLRDLVDQVLGGEPVEPMGVYFFGPDDPGADLARHVERVVFEQAFGNTAEMLAEEYGKYESNSVFLCVIDHHRRLPAGMMRIVLPDTDGCGSKTFDDIEPFWGCSVGELARRSGYEMPLERTWDIATLAIDPAYRGAAAAGLVGLALYQALDRSLHRCNVDWIVAVLDIPVYHLLQRVLKGIFREFDGAEALPYLGSTASLPVVADISEWEPRLLESDPSVFEVVVEGIGFEEAVRPLGPDIPTRLAQWMEELGDVAELGEFDGAIQAR
jgi:hypothetical protein